MRVAPGGAAVHVSCVSRLVKVLGRLGWTSGRSLGRVVRSAGFDPFELRDVRRSGSRSCRAASSRQSGQAAMSRAANQQNSPGRGVPSSATRQADVRPSIALARRKCHAGPPRDARYGIRASLLSRASTSRRARPGRQARVRRSHLRDGPRLARLAAPRTCSIRVHGVGSAGTGVEFGSVDGRWRVGPVFDHLQTEMQPALGRA